MDLCFLNFSEAKKYVFLKKYFTNLQSCVIIAIRKIGKIGDDLDE